MTLTLFLLGLAEPVNDSDPFFVRDVGKRGERQRVYTARSRMDIPGDGDDK